MPGWVIILIGFAILSMAMLRARSGSRRPTERLLRTDNQTREEHLRSGMERLLVTIEEMAREMNARLDSKLHVLNRLINDADERIQRLERLLQAARGEGAPPPRVMTDRKAPLPPPPQVVDPRQAEVYRLADAGVPVLEICRQTRFRKGEVELILGLRRVSRAGGVEAGGVEAGATSTGPAPPLPSAAPPASEAAGPPIPSGVPTAEPERDAGITEREMGGLLDASDGPRAP